MTFSLNGNPIPTDGSAHVLITDINPSGDNNNDALICHSEIPLSGIIIVGDWFLHPTQTSTSADDRIVSTDPRGWNRNRGLDGDRHQLVRLRRADSAVAEEGVFTCNIRGDNNTPRYLGVYYPSELCVCMCV